MTRSDLLTAMGDLTGADVSVAAVKNRYLRHLNRRHREILSWPGSELLRQREITLASVINQALYALPNVENIGEVRELTNDRVLTRRSLAMYRRYNPDPASFTGTPDYLVPIGYQHVALQPSNASELFVKSTSSGDTTQNAYVEGAITGGYPLSVTVSLTGTTAVSLGSNWVRVDKYYLSAGPVGVVTLHEDSGSGTELARIGASQTWQRYFAFYLDQTPADVLTYYFDALYAITDLAQDTDEPWLPHDYHDVLVDGGLMYEWTKKDDSRRRDAEGRWNLRTAELRLRLARQALDDSVGERVSRLGPWVEAGAF